MFALLLGTGRHDKQSQAPMKYSLKCIEEKKIRHSPLLQVERRAVAIDCCPCLKYYSENHIFSMSARHKSAPFSTHARGVPLFDRVRFLDVSKHATRALLDLRDIGSSMFWFFSMQSWLTLWSTIVNIVSGMKILI